MKKLTLVAAIFEDVDVIYLTDPLMPIGNPTRCSITGISSSAVFESTCLIPTEAAPHPQGAYVMPMRLAIAERLDIEFYKRMGADPIHLSPELVAKLSV